MATNIQRGTAAAAEAHHLPAIHMAREVAHLSTPAPPAAKLRRVPPAMAAAMDPSRRRAASRGAPRERRAAPRVEDPAAAATTRASPSCGLRRRRGESLEEGGPVATRLGAAARVA